MLIIKINGGHNAIVDRLHNSLDTHQLVHNSLRSCISKDSQDDRAVAFPQTLGALLLKSRS